jgi:sarcosine oxidase
MMKTYDAVIVGAGSMGSAVSYHLARRGRTVLVLDQFDVPSGLGASTGVNRIIRLAYAEHPDYVPLLRRAYELWRDLEKTADERLLIITGGIDAGRESGEIVRGSLRSCQSHNLEHEVLSATDLHRRFPGYKLPNDAIAVYQPDGGFLMSERCVAAHLNAALAYGAEVHGRERVRGWEVSNGTVRVATDLNRYEARSLVVTAGPWTARTVPTLAPVVVAERQVLLWSQPLTPVLFQVDRFPVFNMEASEGRFYGFPVYSVPGFKIGKYHHNHEQVDADLVDRECHPKDEEILREAIRRYFPAADGPTLAMKVCLFANTPDEHFIIDFETDTPEVVVAAGFSGHGFKFCSVVGEIVADLVLNRSSRFDLQLFRRNRFGSRLDEAGPKL